jgi:hypothetical protein
MSRHEDTKTRRHKDTPQLEFFEAAFLCAFLSLCLCVLHPLHTFCGKPHEERNTQ